MKLRNLVITIEKEEGENGGQASKGRQVDAWCRNGSIKAPFFPKEYIGK